MRVLSIHGSRVQRIRVSMSDLGAKYPQEMTRQVTAKKNGVRGGGG